MTEMEDTAAKKKRNGRKTRGAGITVTKKSYPTLWKAFQELEAENGITRQPEYLVPSSYSGVISSIEKALKGLNKSDFEDFVLANHDTMDEIIKNNPGLDHAHTLLDQFYENSEKFYPDTASMEDTAAGKSSATARKNVHDTLSEMHGFMTSSPGQHSFNDDRKTTTKTKTKAAHKALKEEGYSHVGSHSVHREDGPSDMVHVYHHPKHGVGIVHAMPGFVGVHTTRGKDTKRALKKQNLHKK